MLRSYPFELSGGMMQRTMIALALLCKPPFLIFDEATTALDVITQAQILREINRLQQEFNLTAMVISHDVGVINATVETCRGALRGPADGGRAAEALLRRPGAPLFPGARCLGARG